MDTDGSTSGLARHYRLVVTLPDGGEQDYPLDGREVTVGRDPSNQVQIRDHLVSQFHAKLVRSGPSLSVVDLGSANKTRVNGRVVVNKPLKEGDLIQFAGVRCRLVTAEGRAALGHSASPTKPPAKTPGVDRPEEARGACVGAAQRGRAIPKALLLAGVMALFGLAALLALQVC